MENRVYVGVKDVVMPRASFRFYSFLWGGGFFVSFLFLSILGAFVWAVLFPLTIAILYVMRIISVFPKLRYTCPHCHHVHQTEVWEENEQEVKWNGYIQADCHKCRGRFPLIVDKGVLSMVVTK